MSGMFNNAEAFNGDLSSWDTSKVTDMSAMFYGADAFNRNLFSWDVSNVRLAQSFAERAQSFKDDASLLPSFPT